MTAAGLPTLTGIHHVALTVPDLDAAVAFYTGVIGGRERFRLGPFDARELPPAADGRDWTHASVNVPDACVRLALVDLGDRGTPIELFEYARPAGRPDPPGNHDAGGHHVALHVRDLEAAAAYLREHGLEVFDRIDIDDGPAAGQHIRYVLDPWGNQLELIEWDR